MEQIQPAKNVLSISSHVTHGYVGNDALQLPLNLRNWNFDAMHTTHFSTHPGHGPASFTGQKTTCDVLLDLFKGLSACDLIYDAVIVGYIATEDNLNAVWNNIINKVKNDKNNSAVIIVDPIMGDNGKFYVSESIVDSYKLLLSKNRIDVDILAPNQFEFETLTGTKLSSWERLKNGIEVFRKLYPKIENLVITSVSFENNDSMYCVGSSNGEIFYFELRQVNAVFSGSGDLFLGLLMDEYIKSHKNLQYALGSTIRIVEQVLELTYELALSKNEKNTKKINGKLYIPDLKLVESKEILLSTVNIMPTANFIH